MIRIPTYKEHPNGKAIFDRYLYLAALVLPFSPEEVIGEDELTVDGRIVTADNFLEITGKRPRMRNENYRNRIVQFKAGEVLKDKAERFYQDRILARNIIQETSPQLYRFLYLPGAAPEINKENLRTLLTVKMDELLWELQNIPRIEKKEKDILLAEVFRYQAFSEEKEFIALLKDMDVRVCPYCNMQHTFTVSENGRQVRPQIDHFKPKEKYPYFGISLMNLVPSCASCNLSKSDKEKAILYPYSDEMGYDMMFRTKMTKDFNYLFGDSNAIDEFDLVLEKRDGGLNAEFAEKADNAKDIFHLEGLYDKQKSYVLNLFRKNYVFSDAYLDTIYKEFPEMFPLRSDMKNLLYLMDITKAEWGKRALAKLTHDISKEME